MALGALGAGADAAGGGAVGGAAGGGAGDGVALAFILPFSLGQGVGVTVTILGLFPLHTYPVHFSEVFPQFPLAIPLLGRPPFILFAALVLLALLSMISFAFNLF